MSILGKGRLELADFYAVGELVEKSVKDGVRVNNFDQLNFLKKSFLWTLDFKTFFDDYGENLGRENFMKIVETNQSRPTVPQTFDYEQLLEKINSFGEQLFTEKRIEFLKELLKPVYCVTITDARIKFLINNFKIFIWRYDVEKKLSEPEISLQDLRTLKREAPSNIKDAPNGSDAYNYITTKIDEVEKSFKMMIKVRDDLLDFIQDMDQYKISMLASQEKLSEIKGRFEFMQSSNDEKLKVVKEFRESTSDSVKIARLFEFLETCNKISSSVKVKSAELLNGLDMVNSGELFEVRKSQLIQFFHNTATKYKEYITYFEKLEKKDQPRDIVEYEIAEFYGSVLAFPTETHANGIVKELESENGGLIDFSIKLERLKDELRLHNDWSNNVERFFSAYKIDDLMREKDPQVFAKICQTILHFKREFFDHGFASEVLHKLWSFEWSIDT
jgi:hypothetical protein